MSCFTKFRFFKTIKLSFLNKKYICLHSLGNDYHSKKKYSEIDFTLITDEGFIIKGFKLVNGINGPFVGFPSQKGNDDEYYDTIWADRDIKEQVNQLAIKTYGQEIMTSSQVNEGDDFSPQPQIKPEEVSTTVPFSEEDIPF